MDQMGEVEYQPGEPRGTDWHPHRGFETVTYMIDGAIRAPGFAGGRRLDHRRRNAMDDSRLGILHIETPPAELVDSGGVFHGIQLWVNLPRKDKFAAPKYQAIEGSQVRLLSSDDGGALVRIIAGGDRRTPGTWSDAHANYAGACDHCARGPVESAVEPRFQRPGLRAVGPRLGRPRRASRSTRDNLRCSVPVTRISVTAEPAQESRRPALEILVLGGQPIREPVVQ